ncbi:hypothetical protein [Xenorhabdus bovienii]|uniref:Lipoprotein n=1 Tax=Xenorhabdus bovienii str. kraussei Becker Underwood TaxID=1398204 RepID=A0A077PKJ1_XENBV|nr:hypothetical protein [Xenorhabdus bovienii]CDH24930.1 conserved hypothetical protein [Xenorhabdus bovienii str. kraussei Becker Underwood]
MRKNVIVLLVGAILLAGCDPKGLSPEEAQPVENAPSPNQNISTSNKSKTEQQLLPAADGPFGLQMGLTKKNIEDMIGQALKPTEYTNVYLVDRLPKTNDSFENYGLLISPTLGLCKINAIGKDIENDTYGISLRVKFDDLKTSLDSIYGESKKTDLLLPGSIWNEPRDWMRGLNKEERVLYAVWDSKSGALQKSNIEYLLLKAKASDSSSGHLLLQYEFKNHVKCADEINNAKKDSL